MAVLRSEDEEYKTWMELQSGDAKIIEDQTLQQFTLILQSGGYELKLGGKATDTSEREACMLCRKPKDEVRALIEQTQELIDSKREKVLFEPSEPSFELSITRARIGGFKVEVWSDAGNAKTGFYRWDGVGIRFFTLQEHLVSFLKELEKEFAW